MVVFEVVVLVLVVVVVMVVVGVVLVVMAATAAALGEKVENQNTRSYSGTQGCRNRVRHVRDFVDGHSTMTVTC